MALISLWDEYGKPFWSFSSLVCMRFLGPLMVLISWDRLTMLTHKGKMLMMWIKETEYFIVSLVLFLRIAKISHCFGTTY